MWIIFGFNTIKQILCRESGVQSLRVAPITSPSRSLRVDAKMILAGRFSEDHSALQHHVSAEQHRDLPNALPQAVLTSTIRIDSSRALSAKYCTEWQRDASQYSWRIIFSIIRFRDDYRLVYVYVFSCQTDTNLSDVKEKKDLPQNETLVSFCGRSFSLSVWHLSTYSEVGQRGGRRRCWLLLGGRN